MDQSEERAPLSSSRPVNVIVAQVKMSRKEIYKKNTTSLLVFTIDCRIHRGGTENYKSIIAMSMYR